MSKINDESIDQNEQSTPEIISVGGSSFVKNNDGSLMKLNDDYDDDSNLIYR